MRWKQTGQKGPICLPSFIFYILYLGVKRYNSTISLRNRSRNA